MTTSLRPYDSIGSTRDVDFDTTKAVYTTDPAKCHVSHLVADTGSWGQKLVETLEEMPEVASYVKNQELNFTIPYTLNGEEKQYFPDFRRADPNRWFPNLGHPNRKHPNR